jgi:hypothetical protein
MKLGALMLGAYRLIIVISFLYFFRKDQGFLLVEIRIAIQGVDLH